MSTLFDRLHDDHKNMRDLLNVLSDLVGRLHHDEVDVDYHLMLDIFDYFTSFPDAVHHPIEDQLFSGLLEKAPEFRAEIEELKAEHETQAGAGREIFKDLQGICAGHLVPRQHLIEMTESYVANLRAHMQKEEAQIIAVARRRIPEKEWKIFERQHEREIDPLFGSKVRDTFKRLHDYVMESVSS